MKEKICADFLTAFKAGEREKKNTLGMLKSLITEAEKHPENVGKELTDAQVLAVVQGYDKNLDKTIEALKNADSEVVERSKATLAEKEYIKSYLLKQIDEQFIKQEIDFALGDIGRDRVVDRAFRNKAVGAIMNHFKKQYAGQYNPMRLKQLAEETIDWL